MAKKLSVVGNYLLLTDTVDSSTIEFPTSRVRYKDYANSIIFEYIDDESQSIEIDKSDLLDSTGTAFESDSALLVWLRANTDKSVPLDYIYEVAKGRIQNTELWNKFGYNNDLDIGTEVVASWGGTFTPLTTATTLTISSTDGDDTDGGTGCNSIVVYGIDENRDAQIEVVTLDGTNNVVTTSTWLGINRIAMFLCGTSQVNEGTINITATTGGSQMAQMPLNEGVSQQCIFHVPRNYTFVSKWLWVNVINRGKNATLTFKFWVYSAVSNGKQEVFKLDVDTSKSSEPISVEPDLPFPITEKTVIWIECTSDVANVIVNARFSGILENNKL